MFNDHNWQNNIYEVLLLYYKNILQISAILEEFSICGLVLKPDPDPTLVKNMDPID